MLKYSLTTPAQLSASNIDAMFTLMASNYNQVVYVAFIDDLTRKDYVGLLYNGTEIKGFTTFAINPYGTGTDEYSILFSGDTIIAPDAWGSMELIRGWSITAGKILAELGGKKLYWLLISKGHRTYMYLPLFFNNYYPKADETTTEKTWILINQSAQTIFGNNWKPESGLIIFESSLGELKPSLAEGTYKKARHPDVKFFLEKNPGFYKGDELLCFTEIAPENMKGYARKYLLEGMISTPAI